MKVSKEIANKVIRLNKLKKEVEAIREELLEFFGGYMDGVYIYDFFVKDEPAGKSQGEGEYCVQWAGYSEDSGDGIYYYPIEGSKKYVAISYEF